MGVAQIKFVPVTGGAAQAVSETVSLKGFLNALAFRRTNPGDDVINIEGKQYILSTMEIQGSTPTSETGLVAKPGGGQAGAKEISEDVAKFDTVAADNDSSILKAAQKNDRVTVLNDGAKVLDIYTKAGEKFDGLAVDAPIQAVAGARRTMCCLADGVWTVL